MIRFRFFWPIIASVVSGVLTSVGFPRGLTVQNPLAWILPIAMVPLFIAIEKLPTTYQSPARAHSSSLRQVTPLTRGLEAFLMIWIYGATLVALAFQWVTVPAMLFGELSPLVTQLLFCLYCLLASLYFPILFFPLIWNASRCSKRSTTPFPIWALVFSVTLLEIVIPRFFHWTYGNLMHGSLPVVQWAAWIGSSGLSSFIFASNFTLARALSEPSRNPGRLGLTFLATVAAWIAIYAIGDRRLSDMQKLQAETRKTHVGFVQPNFRFPGLPRNPDYAKEAVLQTLPSLIELTDELVSAQKDSEKLDLIIWPESSAPFDVAWSEPIQNEIRKKIEQWKSPVLIQGTEFDKTELEALGPQKAKLFSISFLLRPDGSRSPSFQKWVPMPFGEAVPLEDTFPWLGDLVRDNVNNVSKLGRGTNVDALAYSPSDAVAPLICFDAISSSLTRAQATVGGATIFVNQANFLWMWKSTAAFQFVQLGRFRAIENGRSFILSANTGPSAAFTPTGELIGQPLGLMSRGFGSAHLPVIESKTLFADWGEQPLIILGIIAFGVLVFMGQPWNRHIGRT